MTKPLLNLLQEREQELIAILSRPSEMRNSVYRLTLKTLAENKRYQYLLGENK